MPYKEPRTTYVLFYIGLVLFFAPFIILSFFNHPSADDYILGYHMRNEGFGGFQQSTYLHWGGRFASTFLGACLALYDFLFYHYYFHTIVLVAGTLISVFYLFATVNKYLLKQFYTRWQVFTAAAVYVVVLCCCYAELSTAFFWFSSAITYQLPTALFHAGVAFSIRAGYATLKSRKRLYTVQAIICIILVTGANEMIALCLGVVIVLTYLLVYRFYPSQRNSMALYTLVYLLGLAVLAFSPGARERSAEIPHAGVASTLLFALGRSMYTLFYIGKQPLFWLCGIWTFLQSQGIARKENLLLRPIFQWVARYSKWLISTVPLLLIVVYTPVMFISNGSLPDRATNTCIFFGIFLLFLCFAALGAVNNNEYVLAVTFKKLMAAAIAISLVCNDTFFSLPQNVIAGYFYDKVIAEREHTLTAAKDAVPKIAVLKSYDSALHEQTVRHFPGGLRNKIDVWIKRKPEMIYVFDDLATDYSRDFLKRYYQVDTLIIK